MKKLQKWTIKKSELALDERWARVRRDVCLMPNGDIIDDYFYWDGGNFAQVFAIDKCEMVVLVQQYKHGVQEIVTELPAGGIGPKDKEPIDAAKRELLEETGYSGGEWRSLGVLNVSSAKANTRAYPFVAIGVENTEKLQLDQTEDIQVIIKSIPEVLNMMVAGEIRDSNSIAACLRALRMLGKL